MRRVAFAAALQLPPMSLWAVAAKSADRANAELKTRAFGWEAGIRTPITWSRATCPTVGRPPSTSRRAREGRKLRL